MLLVTTPLVVLRLARVIRRIDPHVVLVNTVTLPHWTLAARLARRPAVVHVHEAEEMIRPFARRVLYAPLLLADRVIANSETTRRVLVEAWPKLNRRTRVIVNGIVDRGAASLAATRSGHLVVVSRLSPRKGIDTAVRAVAELVRAGRDVSLTLCGSVFSGYEWYEQQLRAEVHSAGLDDRVRFAGSCLPSRSSSLRPTW